MIENSSPPQTGEGTTTFSHSVLWNTQEETLWLWRSFIFLRQVKSVTVTGYNNDSHFRTTLQIPQTHTPSL